MFTEFKLGDTVKVWPRPGLRVQAHGNTPGRFLSADGEEVTWSNWHYELARAGSIVFTDPTETHALAEHDNGSAAKAALDAHQAELDAAKAKAEADKQAELDAKAAEKQAAADGIEKTPIATVDGKGALTVTDPALPAAKPLERSTAEAPASATKENA